MPPSDTQDCDAASEAADQTTPNTHRVPEIAPQDDQDGAKKRDVAGETTTAGAEPTERPAKKMKRGKYISRACTSCQQRKIKCEGGDPCRQCLAKKLPCQSSGPRGGQQGRRDSRTGSGGSQDQASYSSSDGLIGREVLVRLEAVERHLRLLRPPNPDPVRPALSHTSVDDQLKPSAAKLQDALETDGQTFAGEITMTPTFEDENDRLDHNSSVSSATRVDYSSPASSLHLPATSPGHVTGRKRGWFESLLASHGVTADEQQSRSTDPSGVDSSGWSLHNVGMSLLGDLLETSNTAIKSLLMLQVLMIRSMYLFRLDANQKAARVHALTVSVAQTIGLHRQGTIEKMPAYYNQLYSRTWWAIYMLDRRLAIESGKPYLIQDSNVDTALPIDLSDEWMTRFASRKETLADLQHEVAAEIARDSSPSCIPYVVATVRYGRVAGKTWEVLYGVKASAGSISAMVEYVDIAIDNLLSTVPRSLQYDPDVPYETQFGTRPRWQVKQTFLFNNCCTYLRLLIRRPLLPNSSARHHTEEDDLESSIECASLAARILTTHQNLLDNGIKYSFALSHYVTSCAMVMIGLVSREPGSKRRYGGLILAATRCLNEYCQKRWVSGKMIRCVSRLSRLVERVLNLDAQDGQNHPSPSSLRRDSVSERMTHHLTPPQTEDQDPRQMQYGVGASNIFTNQLKVLAIDNGGSTQRDQGADYYSYNHNPLDTMAERQTESLTKLPAPWIAEPGIDRRNSWIMSDFTFETFGELFGPSDAELPTLIDNDRLELTQGMDLTADRGLGEARLGVLGMNSMFDLDMDLNLYST